jgi:hypothetical protein
LKGKKTGGRDFEPGNAGGPGRPEVLPQVKEFKKWGKENTARMLTRIGSMSYEELLGLLAKPSWANALELAVGSVLMNAIVNGEHQGIEWLLNRTIGPVKQEIEVTQKQELPTREEAVRILETDYACLPPTEVKVEEL